MIRNNYLNAIRADVDLLVRRGRMDQVIVWHVGSDEKHDPTLIAWRAYSNRDYADVVMVCAGTNSISEPLPESDIYLPTVQSLMRIRKAQSRGEVINYGQ
ncbi:MAG: hypothetical protein Q4P13_11260 [Psychrobacter sp.]|nr:hypothetical protein [Psychrobacter sp.]